MFRLATLAASSVFAFLVSSCSLPSAPPTLSDLIGSDATPIEKRTLHFDRVDIARTVYNAPTHPLVYDLCRTQPKNRFSSQLGIVLSALFRTPDITMLNRKGYVSLYLIAPAHRPAFVLLATRSADYRTLRLYYPLDTHEFHALSKWWGESLSFPPLDDFYRSHRHLPFALWDLPTLQLEHIVIHDK